MKNNEGWTLVINPKTRGFSLGLKELWSYRDLVMLFVKRDFVAFYKQTILGPLWYIIQPFLTILIFAIVFGSFAKIPTQGMPPLLFYMAGLIGWNYFAECLNKTSLTFINNANIFGKVYFPRLCVPVSIIISSFIGFMIQLLFLILMLIFYYFKGFQISLSLNLLAIPFIILIIALLGLGLGIIVSSLTTKYRDLRFVVTFGVQLLMYTTPIIYPMSSIPIKYRAFILLNPMTPLVDSFRTALLGSGNLNWTNLLYSFIFSIISLLAGAVLFHKIEKSFMDTI